MIPKKIHYCWFGGNALNECALKCIDSWKRYFPDYEIIEWNEYNFDITQDTFVKNAYEAGKWAFVSDVARLIIVYKYGGIYFDTDVEVIKSYDDILDTNKNGFLAYESTGYINTGLGFAAEANNPLIKGVLNKYSDIDFNMFKSNLQEIACPIITTDVIKNQGIIKKGEFEYCKDIIIYPQEYFSPIDYLTGRVRINSHTHSIHHYEASWNSDEDRKKIKLLRKLRRIMGRRLGDVLFDFSQRVFRI